MCVFVKGYIRFLSFPVSRLGEGFLAHLVYQPKSLIQSCFVRHVFLETPGNLNSTDDVVSFK